MGGPGVRGQGPRTANRRSEIASLRSISGSRFAISSLLFLIGCGGSTGGDSPATKQDVQVNVTFAPRAARLEGGESAQSVRLTFTNGDGNTTTTFDRGATGLPTVQLLPGTYTLTATFTALAGGLGDTVATASGPVAVTGSGVLNEGLAIGTKVATVSITPAAHPGLYPTVSNLGLQVRDASGNLLGVPGDACSLISSETGDLQPIGGGFSALFEGTLNVRASVDGVRSEAASVDTERSVVTGGTVTPNYVSAVTLGHWDHMPLTVSFDKTGLYRPDLEARFREAMAQWTLRTKGGVRFADTTTAHDIAVSYVSQATLGGDTIGITYYNYVDTSEGRVHTNVRMQISSDYGTPDEVRYICAHELGHALGIEGHSAGPDLMYYRIGGIYNQRDVNTLRTAYGNSFPLLGRRSTPLQGTPGSGVIVCPK
ncbi:hypothetical protein BH11ARM2_BH11ARM2_13610 [soil metagenome]